MIKLYTYQELLIPENRRQVHPLLFDLHYYEHPHLSIEKYYQLVDEPKNADYFIFPVDYLAIANKGYQHHFKSMLQEATDLNKKVLVYTGGDYGKTFKDSRIITWRNAGFKSTNYANTSVIPSFINDPLEQDYIDLQYQEYEQKPRISFTGFATDSFKEILRSTLATFKGNLLRAFNKNKSDYQKRYNASGKRYKLLKCLENNSQISTDFIYRNAYRAGAITREDRAQSTKEFFQNLNNSPYVFCLRGAGNFSVRFYEALALGKIPVLMDTDVQLPLEHLINWDQHICRVQVHQDLNEVLLNFHRSQDVNSFMSLQKANRELFEHFLVRHAYFHHIHDHLKSLL